MSYSSFLWHAWLYSIDNFKHKSWLVETMVQLQLNGCWLRMKVGLEIDRAAEKCMELRCELLFFIKKNEQIKHLTGSLCRTSSNVLTHKFVNINWNVQFCWPESIISPIPAMVFLSYQSPCNSGLLARKPNYDILELLAWTISPLLCGYRPI